MSSIKEVYCYGMEMARDNFAHMEIDDSLYIKLESSWIDVVIVTKVDYMPELEVVLTTLQGREYHYIIAVCDMAKFFEYNSAGKAYHAVIRGHYHAIG